MTASWLLLAFSPTSRPKEFAQDLMLRNALSQDFTGILKIALGILKVSDGTILDNLWTNCSMSLRNRRLHFLIFLPASSGTIWGTAIERSSPRAALGGSCLWSFLKSSPPGQPGHTPDARLLRIADNSIWRSEFKNRTSAFLEMVWHQPQWTVLMTLIEVHCPHLGFQQHFWRSAYWQGMTEKTWHARCFNMKQEEPNSMNNWARRSTLLDLMSPNSPCFENFSSLSGVVVGSPWSKSGSEMSARYVALYQWHPVTGLSRLSSSPSWSWYLWEPWLSPRRRPRCCPFWEPYLCRLWPIWYVVWWLLWQLFGRFPVMAVKTVWSLCPSEVVQNVWRFPVWVYCLALLGTQRWVTEAKQPRDQVRACNAGTSSTSQFMRLSSFRSVKSC